VRAPLATSAATAPETGLPDKLCHNLYIEPNPLDPKRLYMHVETPGSLALEDFAGAIRGMFQADGHASGKVLIGQGTTLSTYLPSTDTAGTITGTLPGSDSIDAAFTETEAFILADGKLCVSDGLLIRRATDGVTSDPVLAIGSTPANVATAAFTYSINGTAYNKTAVAAGTAPGNDVVPLGTYGAVALDIDAAGTITAIEAPANATGYATAALAAAALPDVATTLIRIGYVTASKSDGAFTFGTTALNAANTTVAYTDSATNTGFTDLLTDAGESAFTSVASLGQRGLATLGSRFIYTAVLDLSFTDALSYYTAESSPDSLIGGRVLGEYYYLFGTRTIEVWAQTGDADDPFQLQPGMTLQIGALCRDGIVKTDNSLFFVDDDCNVRRLGVGSAEIISEPWVNRMLRGVSASTIRGFTYADEGHIFVGFRTATGCAVYDVMTGLWHTRGSLTSDTLRWQYFVKAAGSTFVGDADGIFDKYSRDYTSEHMADASTMGTEIVREVTAFAAVSEGRNIIKSIRLEGNKGIGLVSGQGVAPVVQMRLSTDNGQTWSAFRDAALGAQGNYATRTIWRRCGRARPPGVVLHFRKSDPVRMVITGCAVDEDG